MGKDTGIEWTDATWNPIRGCSRVSEGCRNCYAEQMAYRFSAMGQPYAGLVVMKNNHARWTGKVDFVEKHLLDPLKWKPGRPIFDASSGELVGRDPKRSLRIFVNSMSDLFHENVTDEMLDKIFAVMALCPQHTFQVLTKRPERMLEYLHQAVDERDMQRWHNAAIEAGIFQPKRTIGSFDEVEWPLLNVWLGVSVENQAAADERIPVLLGTPAAVRFISAEPLLGHVDIVRFMPHWKCQCGAVAMPLTDEITCSCEKPYEDDWSRSLDGYGLSWVIVGGESGPGARPMHPDWARSLRDQCAAAKVPFFFKQWGEWLPASHNGGYGDAPERVGKKAAVSLLDGREHKSFPEAR